MLDKMENKYNIIMMIFAVVIFSFASGYFISRIQNQSSFNKYNETITELRTNNSNLENIVTSISVDIETKNIEFSNLEKRFQEKSDKLNELDQSFNSIISGYKNNIIELNKVIDHYQRMTRVKTNNTKIIKYNMIFEYEQDFIVSSAKIFDELSNETGMILGVTESEGDVFSFSWEHLTETPDLESSLNAVNSSISNKITEKGERIRTHIQEYEVMHESHEIFDRGAKFYLLYATWYDDEDNMYYFYSTQSRFDVVFDRFMKFMYSFETI